MYAHNSCTAAYYTFTSIMYTAAIPFITQPARQTKFVCSDAYACDDDASQTVTNTHRYRVFSLLLLRLLLCLCKYNCTYLCVFIITQYNTAETQPPEITARIAIMCVVHVLHRRRWTRVWRAVIVAATVITRNNIRFE